MANLLKKFRKNLENWIRGWKTSKKLKKFLTNENEYGKIIKRFTER